MKKYCFLAENIKKGTAFAYKMDMDVLAHELNPSLKGKSECPFALTMRKVDRGQKGLQVSDDLSSLKWIWLDSQPSNLGWVLFSERMKNIVADNLTGNEGVIWMKVEIHSDDETRPYFALQFEKPLDVLDTEKTVYVEGTDHIVFPHFSSEKVERFSVFSQPSHLWEFPTGIYVTEDIRKAIIGAKLTGVTFEEVGRVS